MVRGRKATHPRSATTGASSAHSGSSNMGLGRARSRGPPASPRAQLVSRSQSAQSLQHRAGNQRVKAKAARAAGSAPKTIEFRHWWARRSRKAGWRAGGKRPALAREGQGRGRAAGAAGREFPGEGSSSPSPGECGSTRAPSPSLKLYQAVTPHSAYSILSGERRPSPGRTSDPLPQGIGRLNSPLPPALSAGRVSVLAL